ncbi:MAG: acetamidase/formamidase family protein [Bacteroidota bacterium]
MLIFFFRKALSGFFVIFCIHLVGCQSTQSGDSATKANVYHPVADHTLSRDQTHNKFSSAIEPVLKVSSGAVIEAFTEDASDKQLLVNATLADLRNLSFDPIHPLTGPVYVEEAEPGDILAVKLHKIDLIDYGWNAITPGFGFLSDEFTEPYIKTYSFDSSSQSVAFNDKIQIPLRPFPGVMGVAPATSDSLNTIPPRANGGNMDDPNMVEGATIYFPVFVKGGLFSIGDGHAAQGLGEVCGTAIEAPLKILYDIHVIKGRKIKEPQYETEDYYAVTAFATTLDEAAKKAVRYMIDYLEAEHELSRKEAYALCSLSGDLKIAEVVDVPHVLVTMHISKSVLGI